MLITTSGGCAARADAGAARANVSAGGASSKGSGARTVWRVSAPLGGEGIAAPAPLRGAVSCGAFGEAIAGAAPVRGAVSCGAFGEAVADAALVHDAGACRACGGAAAGAAITALAAVRAAVRRGDPGVVATAGIGGLSAPSNRAGSGGAAVGRASRSLGARGGAAGAGGPFRLACVSRGATNRGGADGESGADSGRGSTTAWGGSRRDVSCPCAGVSAAMRRPVDAVATSFSKTSANDEAGEPQLP